VIQLVKSIAFNVSANCVIFLFCQSADIFEEILSLVSSAAGNY